MEDHQGKRRNGQKKNVAKRQDSTGNKKGKQEQKWAGTVEKQKIGNPSSQLPRPRTHSFYRWKLEISSDYTQHIIRIDINCIIL